MGRGSINLHGHSHGRLKSQPRQFDVGVDVWNFRLVRLLELVEKTTRHKSATTASES
jgi:calcineurin-like phosphoesterase family protein